MRRVKDSTRIPRGYGDENITYFPRNLPRFKRYRALNIFRIFFRRKCKYITLTLNKSLGISLLKFLFSTEEGLKDRAIFATNLHSPLYWNTDKSEVQNEHTPFRPLKNLYDNLYTSFYCQVLSPAKRLPKVSKLAAGSHAHLFLAISVSSHLRAVRCFREGLRDPASG